MQIPKNSFRAEELRDKLAKQNRFKMLLKTYTKSFPEISDQNSAALWDHLNIKARKLLGKNPMEEDRLNLVSKMIKGKRIKVLDAGFGAGSLEENYFRKNPIAHVEWMGIDISKKSVLKARKLFPFAKFDLGKITSIKYPKASFDFVVALEVLEHIRPRATFVALKQVLRVLKPGGYLIISVPLNEGLEEMIKKGENPNAHVRIYSPELIKAELKIAGFEIKRMKTLYAFNSNYKIKSLTAKYLLSKKFKPNNIIIQARKPE